MQEPKNWQYVAHLSYNNRLKNALRAKKTNMFLPHAVKDGKEGYQIVQKVKDGKEGYKIVH